MHPWKFSLAKFHILNPISLFHHKISKRKKLSQVLKGPLNRLVKTIVTGIMCNHFSLLKFFKKKFKRRLSHILLAASQASLIFTFFFLKLKMFEMPFR